MNKYHNKRVIVDGIRFDSIKEANRWNELCLLQRAGKIKELRRQVPYVIIPKSVHGRAIKYVADFVYIEDNKEIIEDTKGVRTQLYKIKKRLMAEQGNIIQEI